MWQQPAPSPFAAASPREFGSGGAAATLGSSASWAGAVGSQARPAPQFGSFGAPVSSGMPPAGGTTWNGGSQWSSGACAPRPGELPGEGENGCGGSPAIGCGGSGSDANWRPLGFGAGASSSSSAVSPWVLGVPEGPERPRMRRHPPFTWQPATDFLGEFRVSGDAREVVTKVGDFWEPGTVVPAAGTLQMSKGGLYHWTLLLERLPPQRPQIQFGLHGVGHSRPMRVLSSTRCSRARDDDPWEPRPAGDRALAEGDYVHVQVDLRGLHLPFGTLSVAVNAEPPEIVFDDIPLGSGGAAVSTTPVIAMGGDSARVRLCPAY
mmetsp:Transcript_17811/g.48830  ORF Transcript_17811/g.48830 Transcript_17811/m.48830 type:complete len:321 (+) Transcript_17811:121-1083(+)